MLELWENGEVYNIFDIIVTTIVWQKQSQTWYRQDIYHMTEKKQSLTYTNKTFNHTISNMILRRHLSLNRNTLKYYTHKKFITGYKLLQISK